MCFCFKIFEHIIGVKVKATRLENNTAPAIEIPNSLNNLPVFPPIIEIGTKTAIKESVVAITAKPICLEPLNEAKRTGSLFSILLFIFSRTTIASSTTKPTAKTYARRVKTFIEKLD